MKSTKYTNHQYQYPRAAMQMCAEVIIIIINASKESSTCNLSELHESICAKFDAVIKRCRADLRSDSAALELIYPLAALADETFLSIPRYRYYWSERPLRLCYFGEAAGGAKFFSRLDAHVNASSPKREVLDMYFVSMALGLKGMFGVDGSGEQRRRQNIFESLGAMLINIRKKGRGAEVSECVDNGRSVVSGMMVAVVSLGLVLLIMLVTAVIHIVSYADLLNFLEQF